MTNPNFVQFAGTLAACDSERELKDPNRLAALQKTRLLDSSPVPALDRLAGLAARILKAPVALVTLVHADRQLFPGCHGLREPWVSLRESPLSHSFCQYVVLSARRLVVNNALRHPLVKDNASVRDLNVVAYLGVPLTTSRGETLGAFCVIDQVERQWTDADAELLQELATSVMAEIQLRQEGFDCEQTRRQLAKSLRQLAFQNELLHKLSSDTTLEDLLGFIIRKIESQVPEMYCSILLVEDQARLRTIAAPRLPEAFSNAINGTRIGPNVGSCGAAAYLKVQVIAADIATDPRWRDYAGLALSHDLHACWSTPIFKATGEVLGTFAVYYREPRNPDREHLELVETASSLARVAIEHKQSEQERSKLEEQLRQAQKLKAIGTLAGGVAHDFNNILGIILGNIELAQYDQHNPEALSEHLADISKAGFRARELIRQILTFSGHQRPVTVSLDLRSAVREAARFARATIPSTIEIVTSLPEEPLMMVGDDNQIMQILLNLFSNAADAIPVHGSIKVFLDRAFLAGHQARLIAVEDGAYARITVQDDGCGMDAATLRRALEPFFTTKPVGKGTGLGLSVVHGIVQSHQGGISMKSKPSSGTEIDVYLPLAKEAASRPRVSVTPLLSGHGEHILVIDDEKAVALITKRMLERMSYRVSACTDSLTGLKTLQESPEDFNLLLTDYTLPGMTGLELAEKVKTIRPDLPVVLCTGNGAFVDHDKLQELGVRACLLKPVPSELLADTIRSALGNEPCETNFTH